MTNTLYIFNPFVSEIVVFPLNKSIANSVIYFTNSHFFLNYKYMYNYGFELSWSNWHSMGTDTGLMLRHLAPAVATVLCLSV